MRRPLDPLPHRACTRAWGAQGSARACGLRETRCGGSVCVCACERPVPRGDRWPQRPPHALSPPPQVARRALRLESGPLRPTPAPAAGVFFFFFPPVGRWGAVERAAKQHAHKKTQPPRGLGAGRGSWPAATRRCARCARGHAPGPSLGMQTLLNCPGPAKISTRKYPGRRSLVRALGAAGRGRAGGGRGRGAPHAARPREVRPRPASRRLDRDCARGVRPRRGSPRRVRSADRGWGAAAWPWRVCFAPAERAAAQGSGRTPRDRAGSASGARRSERRAERGVA